MPNDDLIRRYIVEPNANYSDDSDASETVHEHLELPPETLLPQPYLLSAYMHYRKTGDQTSVASQWHVVQESELLYGEIHEKFLGFNKEKGTETARGVMLGFARAEILTSMMQVEAPDEVIINIAEVLDRYILQKVERPQEGLKPEEIHAIMRFALGNYDIYMSLWNSHSLAGEKIRKIASEMIIAYERIILAFDPDYEYIPGYKFDRSAKKKGDSGARYTPPRNSFKHHPRIFGGEHRLLG